MARAACVVTCVVLLGIGLSGEARADADPASDYLYVNNVFLPLSTRVSPGLARELADATQAASEAGRPIRVALIAAPADLGGVPTLFGKATDYARFLDAELQFVYAGRLLVVMPQGAALAAHGRLEANKAVIEATVEPGGDGLARTAIALVRTLSGRARTPTSTQPATTRESPSAASPTAQPTASAKGFPIWASAVISVGSVGVLLAGGLILVRRRLRVRDLAAGASSEVAPSDPDDPYRYKAP